MSESYPTRVLCRWARLVRDPVFCRVFYKGGRVVLLKVDNLTEAKSNASLSATEYYCICINSMSVLLSIILKNNCLYLNIICFEK